MCCDNSGVSPYKVVKGAYVRLKTEDCPDCGQPTIDGETTDHCNYSPVECDTCKWAPCDGSC